MFLTIKLPITIVFQFPLQLTSQKSDFQQKQDGQFGSYTQFKGYTMVTVHWLVHW